MDTLQTPPVVTARRSSPAILKRKQSESAAFSSIRATDAADADAGDEDEQEARDKPAPKLQRNGSSRRVTGSKRQLNRRYSAGEEDIPAEARRQYLEQQQQHAMNSMSATGDGDASDQSAQPRQSSGAKGLIEIIHKTVVAKRLSRSSLLQTPGTSFFAAAIAAKELAASNEEAAGQQYEEMMERFQIRRLQHTPSNGSVSGTTGRDSPRGTSRSAKVLPVDTDGANPSTRTPRSHSSLGAKGDVASRQTPSGSEHGSGGSAPTHSLPTLQIPVAPVIKPRSSVRKNCEATGKATESASSERFSLHWLMVMWRRKLRRRVRRVCRHLAAPMSPFSTAARVRALLLVVAYLAHAVYFPIEVAFYASSHRWFHAVDYATELVFVFDFILSFNSSFQDKRGVLVTSRREIAKHYLRGWCLPDLLGAVPAELILYVRGKRDDDIEVEWFHVFADSVVRMQRLIHIARVVRFIWMVHVSRSGKSIWAWLAYSRYSHLLRIFWIVLFLVLIAHYMACCWKLLEEPDSLRKSLPITEQYAANFYDALQLLQGQGLATYTISQSTFASFSVLVGSVMLAIVFGNVAMLVSNFNANSTTYQRKMETVFAIMSKLQLPTLLRERIHQYYEHLWREYESLDGELVKFSKGLTHNLALEVVLFKYMDLVLNVPLWRDCTPDFQKQIVLSLQVRVYLPDDFILRRGEVGDEFYMINRGSCELSTGSDSVEQATPPLPPRIGAHRKQGSDASNYVRSAYYSRTEQVQRSNGESEFDKRSRFKSDRNSDDDGSHRKRVSKYVRLLTRGQAFGEVALLMNYQRTANVRAVTYVEMCVLSRADFQKILTRYPVDRKHAISNILTTCMESNESRHVYCPLKEAVKLVFRGRRDYLAEEITARYAATIISAVVNADSHDETKQFGGGINFTTELAKLKERDASVSMEARSALPQRQVLPSVRTNGRVVDTPSKVRASVSSNDKERHTAPSSSASGTESASVADLDERIQRIESAQFQTLQLMHEMRAAMNELRPMRVAPARASETLSVPANQPSAAESLPVSSTKPTREAREAVESTRTKGERSKDAASSDRTELDARARVSATPLTRRTSRDDPSCNAPPPKIARVGSRRLQLRSNRSSSSPSLLELSQIAGPSAVSGALVAGSSSAVAGTTIEHASNPPTSSLPLHQQPQPVQGGNARGLLSRSSSRRRSITLRDLTEKEKEAVKAAPPIEKWSLIRSPFRLRRRSDQTGKAEPRGSITGSKKRTSSSSITKRLLLQGMGSLVSFATSSSSGLSTPQLQQSPTCYADQLFQAREQHPPHPQQQQHTAAAILAISASASESTDD